MGIWGTKTIMSHEDKEIAFQEMGVNWGGMGSGAVGLV